MKKILVAAVFVGGLASILAQGTIEFIVHPTGAEELPPNSSTNLSGLGHLTLNGTTLTYYFGITPESLRPVTSATINGPAGVGVLGPELFNLTAPTSMPPWPPWFLFRGTIDNLTAAQINDLSAGLWYVNVFSDASFPGGEYRGQILLVPEPSALSLLGLAALSAVVWLKRLMRPLSE